MEDFVSFKLAQRLKEKGFTIPTKSIFGMYNEIGVFHALTTSADYDICDSGFKCRCYYDYDDFDERDFIAPTISQVLKWLRKEKNVHIKASVYQDESEDSDGRIVDKWCFWNWDIQSCISGNILQDGDDTQYESYEEASLAGIEYCLDNLI